MSNLYGLFGEKLSHSLSPKIQSRLLDEIGQEGYYHLFELKRDDLKSAIDGLNSLSARGVNVTVPYKIDVMKHLDKLSDEAMSIGAVNTISFKDGCTKGYNTDYYGFGIMVDKLNINLVSKKAVVLGTGGASKAIVAYLKDGGIGDLVMVSRSREKAKELSELTGIDHITYADLKNLKGFDIIINTTPCGMYPNTQDSPVDVSIIREFKYALDIIYNPSETAFLRLARENNVKGINGLYMLIGQALKAQEIWNSTHINKSIVDDIYDELIKEFEV